jgi:mannitol/fructose-specific phosphotransferase system IIA component (Ntr-type)
MSARLSDGGKRSVVLSAPSDRHGDKGDVVIVLLDVQVEEDLNDCLRSVHARLCELLELTPALQETIREVFEQHADLGFEALDHQVGVLHQQLEDCPNIQVLVRLPEKLCLKDEHGDPTRFLWILLSSHATHPMLDAAAEFSRLMADSDFREAACAAKKAAELDTVYHAALDAELHFSAHIPPELQRTGKLFGGLLADIKRRAPFYLSDYKDGLSGKSLASIVFLFFACIAPAVAFGGLLAQLTHGSIGAIEMIVATTICGVTYALFSGQPLTILGSTGPIIIFMGILYDLCVRFGLPYEATLGWVGLWTAGFLIILTATDACSLIRYFTRFTDDTFAALISIIFIFEALRDVVSVFTGHQVHYATALLSLILALGTYMIARGLSRSRRSLYLRRSMREFLADFGPTIAIITMSGVAYWLHEVELKTLAVPDTFGTTSGRPWLVNLMEAPHWTRFAAAIPALLVSILVYLDQNITVRLVNNPEYKLKKGSGYHLDLMVVSLLIAVCSLFGLPWMVAATVRSLNHVRSLALLKTEQQRDGVHERVVGVVENRVTGLMVHVLVGLSLLALPLLKQVPMAVLFGLFLFMGVASMTGNQLFERLELWLMDPTHYPPTYYLRAVPTRVVHTFTLIQFLALVLLWVVKASALGILFPLFIALLVPVRMSMARFFKQEHLALLDAEESPEDEEFRETE